MMKLWKRSLFLPLLGAMFALVGLPEALGEEGAGSGRLCLTVLHNNDPESQLLQAGEGALADYGGAAEFVALVQRERARAHRDGCTAGPDLAVAGGDDASSKDELSRAVITVSAGDNLLAGPELMASFNLPPDKPFYDSIALGEVGYDALALGNHEFDFGPDVLARFIADMDRPAPFLSANLDFSEEPELRRLADEGRIAKSVVVVKGDVSVGIIGATTMELRSISSPRNTIIEDVRAAVQREIDALTAQGVKIVVLVSHLQSVNEDLALVPRLRGVDITIAGGGDEVLANPGDRLVSGDEERVFGPYPLYATASDGVRVPVVTASGGYRYVGRLDCEFDGSGVILACSGGPRRVARFPESGIAPEDAVSPHLVVHQEVTEPVRRYVEALGDQVIGRSEVALDGRRVPVRTVETNLGNLAADAILWTAEIAAESGKSGLLPDVAIQNGGGIRNADLRGPGDISVLDTVEVLPFANFVTVIRDVSRDHFRQVLEHALSRVEDRGGRFAQIAGFSFTWDPKGLPQRLDEEGKVDSAGTRVVDAILDDGTLIVAAGEVIEGPALNIATIDFLARGGDDYPFRGAPFESLGISYQQALRSFIEIGLGGKIGWSDYPEGGNGRIIQNR